jgi:hypothetical protein
MTGETRGKFAVPKRTVVIVYSPEQKRKTALARARVKKAEAQQTAIKRARAKAKAEKALKTLRALAGPKASRPRNVSLQFIAGLSPQTNAASFGRDGDKPNRLTSEAEYIRDNGA